MFTREQGPGFSVLRFRGVLDAASAREVRPLLLSATKGNVTLDLSKADSIDYYGLSALVSEIQAQDEMTVLLRGLRANQIRMLNYFCIDPARLGLDEGQADAVSH